MSDLIPRKVQLYGNSVKKNVVTSRTIIDSLPGGFGQRSELLPEPIVVEHFTSIEEVVHCGGFVEEMIPSKERECRSCGKGLPLTRHWECTSCKILTDDPGDFLYCEVSGE